MNKQLITTFLFLLVGIYVFGQKDTSELRSHSATECFELSKKDKNYINIGNIIYDDEDDIFICKNMIPIDVEILSKNTMLPVESNLWDWEKCNCAPNLPNNHKAKIDSSQINENKYKMEIKFVDDGDNITLKNKIIFLDNLDLFGKQTKSKYFTSEFSYDENNNSKYPFYTKGIPWKFQLKDISDTLIDVGFKPNTLKQFPLSSLPNDKASFGNIDDNLDITYNGIHNKDSLSCHLCNSPDSLFAIDISAPKSLFVKLYILCDSDDDYENYCVNKDPEDPPRSGDHDYDGSLLSDCITPIDSLDDSDSFECINRGSDGTLDLFQELRINEYWKERKDNNILKPVDSLYIELDNLSNLRILPSIDTSGNHFCNSRPVTSPSDWNQDIDGDGELDAFVSMCPDTTSYDIEQITNDLNIVYSDIGYTINVDNNGVTAKNFNSSSKAMNNLNEQMNFHISQVGGIIIDPKTADTTIIWLVDNLNNLRGRASGDNDKVVYNTLMINTNMDVRRTVSHELGHAAFNLYHPNDSGSINDGFENGPTDEDKFNLMNSGYIYNTKTTHNIYNYRIRKYQWKTIHDD